MKNCPILFPGYQSHKISSEEIEGRSGKVVERIFYFRAPINVTVIPKVAFLSHFSRTVVLNVFEQCLVVFA